MNLRSLVFVIMLASFTEVTGRQTLTSTLPGDDLGEFSTGGLGQTISADGRYTTRATGLGLHLVDVTSKTDAIVRRVDSPRERIRLYANASAISPDASLIAFYQTTGNTSELRIIGRDGQGERILLTSDQNVFHPADWSPNGTSVLVIIRSKAEYSLCLQPLRDSVCRTLVEAQPFPITRARFSPTGEYVAYTLAAAPAVGNAQADLTLFYVPAAGNERAFRRVEIEGGVRDLLGWTPDAYSIVFTRARADGSDVATYELEQRREGRALGSIGGPYAQVLGITPDGQLFYCDTTASVAISELNLQTGVTRVIRAADRRTLVMPTWSPNGDSLFYMSIPAVGSTEGRSLFVMNTATGVDRQVATPTLTIARGASWTSDGRGVLLPVIDGRPRVVRLNVLTGEIDPIEGAQVAEGKDVISWPKVVQRSGDLYFTERPNATGDWDLIRFDSKTRQRQHVAVVDQRFDISPDGQQLALATRNGITVQAVDGTQSNQLVGIETGDRVGAVAWSADGKNLYFARLKSTEIFEVATNGKEAPRAIYTGIGGLPDFAVHPDGRSLAFSAQVSRSHIRRWRLVEPPSK